MSKIQQVCISWEHEGAKSTITVGGETAVKIMKLLGHKPAERTPRADRSTSRYLILMDRARRTGLWTNGTPYLEATAHNNILERCDAMSPAEVEQLTPKARDVYYWYKITRALGRPVSKNYNDSGVRQ